MTNELMWCDEHNCPLVRVGDGYECPVERVDAHLMGKRIQDLIPTSAKSPLTLVFHDGHTLPLLCPDCGGSYHTQTDEEDKILDELAGLYVIGVAYAEPGAVDNDSPEMVVLALGHTPDANPDNPDAIVEEIYVHLESARRLTCPGERRPQPRRRTYRRRRE